MNISSVSAANVQSVIRCSTVLPDSPSPGRSSLGEHAQTQNKIMAIGIDARGFIRFSVMARGYSYHNFHQVRAVLPATNNWLHLQGPEFDRSSNRGS